MELLYIFLEDFFLFKNSFLQIKYTLEFHCLNGLTNNYRSL